MWASPTGPRRLMACQRIRRCVTFVSISSAAFSQNRICISQVKGRKGWEMKQPPSTNHMQEQELYADRESKPRAAPASLKGRYRCKRPSSWLTGFLPVMAFFITKSYLLRKHCLMEDFLKSVFSLMTDRVVQESQGSYALVYVVRAGETEFHQQAASRAWCG